MAFQLLVMLVNTLYFIFSVSSIPESDVELSNDQIDVDEFWGQVCMEILARGFLKGILSSKPVF